MIYIRFINDKSVDEQFADSLFTVDLSDEALDDDFSHSLVVLLDSCCLFTILNRFQITGQAVKSVVAT